MAHHMVCRMVSLCQHREWYREQYIEWYVKCVPDLKQHTEKTKSCTVPVQFQYGAHSTRDRNSFQDHHTLCTSNDSYNHAADRFSTCTHTLPVQNTSQSGPPAPGAHVHKPLQQVLKPGDLVALRKVQHPHNSKTSVIRLPLMKQEILSHYSDCFEGIGQFPGELYKFHLKSEHKPARHVPRKVPIHLGRCFQRGNRNSRRGN